MNKDIIRSKWMEISWEIKERWGKMSDFDLAEVNVDPERSLDLLRRRYGISGRCASDELAKFMDRYPGNSDERISNA